jgi:hypothetical protein
MAPTHFDNGIRFSPIMAQIYESLPWHNQGQNDLAGTGPESFFAWLNASSENHDGDPPISNLADYIYQKRVDLRQVFPNLQGWTRIAFIQWFLIHAQREYDLDDHFINTMQRKVQEWAILPARGDTGVPVVTNLGAYLHATQPKLEEKFPNIYGEHRVDFAVWFLYHAVLERCRRRDLILPIILSWARACRAEK